MKWTKGDGASWMVISVAIIALFLMYDGDLRGEYVV